MQSSLLLLPFQFDEYKKQHNKLKYYKRLFTCCLYVLLKLCRVLLGCAIQIIFVRLFWGNLKLFEFTRAVLSTY